MESDRLDLPYRAIYPTLLISAITLGFCADRFWELAATNTTPFAFAGISLSTANMTRLLFWCGALTAAMSAISLLLFLRAWILPHRIIFENQSITVPQSPWRRNARPVQLADVRKTERGQEKGIWYLLIEHKASRTVLLSKYLPGKKQDLDRIEAALNRGEK